MALRKKGTKTSFKGAVARNAAKQSRGVRYSHLNLPKGIEMFEVEPKTRINLDIMPYVVTDENHPDRDDEYGIATPGTLWYKRPYWRHSGVGVNNETVLCLQTFRQKCPICEHRAQLLREGADWNDETVRALKSSMRNLYAVIPRGSKKFEEKVHIWDVSQFLFQAKLNEEVQEDEEYETFPDLENGFTLQIRFSEGQLGTNRFAETSRIDFKEREPYDESILDEIPSLDEILEMPSQEAIEALFFGGTLPEDDEAEYAAQSRRSGRGQSVRPVDLDDDDDDIDDDVDEEEDALFDDEEEEYASFDDEEEDEEEDEEPEEEPEPPKRARKAAKKEAPAKAATPATRTRRTAKKTRCPHGYTFGQDCDKYDECDDCDMWETCLDASE